MNSEIPFTLIIKFKAELTTLAVRVFQRRQNLLFTDRFCHLSQRYSLSDGETCITKSHDPLCGIILELGKNLKFSHSRNKAIILSFMRI